MAKIETTNLKLRLLQDTTGEFVYQWMQDVNGVGALIEENGEVTSDTRSNFQKVDDAIGSLNTSVASINTRLENFSSLKFKKVNSLPAEAEADSSVIYLVPNSANEQTNIYDEYIFVEATGESDNDKFELVGSTYIDPKAFKVHIVDSLPTSNIDDDVLYLINKKYNYLYYTNNGISQQNQILKYNNNTTYNITSGTYFYYIYNYYSSDYKIFRNTLNNVYAYTNNTNGSYNHSLLNNGSSSVISPNYYRSASKSNALGYARYSYSIYGIFYHSIYKQSNSSYENEAPKYLTVVYDSSDNNKIKYVYCNNSTYANSILGTTFSDSTFNSYTVVSNYGTVITRDASYPTYDMSKVKEIYALNDGSTEIIDNRAIFIKPSYNIITYFYNNVSTTTSSYRRVYYAGALEPVAKPATPELYVHTANEWIQLSNKQDVIDLQNRLTTVEENISNLQTDVSDIYNELSNLSENLIYIDISDDSDSIKSLRGLDNNLHITVKYKNPNNNVDNPYLRSNYQGNSLSGGGITYNYNGSTSYYSFSSIFNNMYTDPYKSIIFADNKISSGSAGTTIKTNFVVNGNRYARYNNNGNLTYRVQIGNIICDIYINTVGCIFLDKVVGQTDDITFDAEIADIQTAAEDVKDYCAERYIADNNITDENTIEQINNSSQTFEDFIYSYYASSGYGIIKKYENGVYSLYDSRYFLPYNVYKYLQSISSGYKYGDISESDSGRYHDSQTNRLNGLNYVLTAADFNDIYKAFKRNGQNGYYRPYANKHFKIKDVNVVDISEIYEEVMNRWNSNNSNSREESSEIQEEIDNPTFDKVLEIVNKHSGSGAIAIGPDNKLYQFTFTIDYLRREAMINEYENGYNVGQPDLSTTDPQSILENILNLLVLKDIKFIPYNEEKQNQLEDAVNIIASDIGLDEIVAEEYPQESKGTILHRLDDNEFLVEKLVNDVYDEITGEQELPSLTEETELPTPGDGNTELDGEINGETELPVEIPETVEGSVLIVDSLPEVGSENIIYRLSTDDKLYKCIKTETEETDPDSNETVTSYSYDYSEIPDMSAITSMLNTKKRYLHIVSCAGTSFWGTGNTHCYEYREICFAIANNSPSAYASAHTAIYDYLGVSQGKSSAHKPLIWGYEWFTYQGDSSLSLSDSYAWSCMKYRPQSYSLSLSYTEVVTPATESEEAVTKTYYNDTITCRTIENSDRNNPWKAYIPTNINPMPFYAKDGSMKVFYKENGTWKDTTGATVTITEATTAGQLVEVEKHRLYDIFASGYELRYRNDRNYNPQSSYAGDYNIMNDTVIDLLKTDE